MYVGCIPAFAVLSAVWQCWRMRRKLKREVRAVPRCAVTSACALFTALAHTHAPGVRFINVRWPWQEDEADGYLAHHKLFTENSTFGPSSSLWYQSTA